MKEHILRTMSLNEQTGTVERAMGEFSLDITSRLQSNHLDWQRLKGG
jgi:hypothetical protein